MADITCIPARANKICETHQVSLTISTQASLTGVVILTNKAPTKKPGNSTQLTSATESLAKAHKDREHNAQATAIAPKTALARKKLSSSSERGKANDMPGAKTSKSNNEAASACHFLRLPAELRLTIYEHYFRDCFEDTSCTQVPYFIRYVHERRMMHTALALLHTNHTLRVEALPPCKQILEAIQEPLISKLKELRKIYMLHFRTRPRFAREIMEKEEEMDLVIQHRTFGKIQNAVQFVERHMIEEQCRQQIDESFKERGRG